jgi:hypothetical protein
LVHLAIVIRFLQVFSAACASFSVLQAEKCQAESLTALAMNDLILALLRVGIDEAT